MSPRTRRTQDFDDVPLSEQLGDEVVAALRVPKARRVPLQRLAARGNCPQCGAGASALVRVGEHLVWREHTYLTWSGARLTCRASGVRLCVVGERRPVIDIDGPVLCSHDVPEAAEPRRRRGKAAGRRLPLAQGWTP